MPQQPVNRPHAVVLLHLKAVIVIAQAHPFCPAASPQFVERLPENAPGFAVGRRPHVRRRAGQDQAVVACRALEGHRAGKILRQGVVGYMSRNRLQTVILQNRFRLFTRMIGQKSQFDTFVPGCRGRGGNIRETVR